MNSIYKRYLLFLGLCIPARLLLAYMAKIINVKYYNYTATIALIPAIVWLYYYFINPRTTGPETFGAPIWWNNYRLIHAALYITYAILAFNKNRNAYIPLLIDALFGLLVFINYHFINK
jgi:hypothetical protein